MPGLPLSVVARRACAETIEVEVDVAVSDLDAIAMNIITAKVESLPIAFSACCAAAGTQTCADVRNKEIGRD
jgi:hypothetical protein